MVAHGTRRCSGWLWIGFEMREKTGARGAETRKCMVSGNWRLTFRLEGEDAVLVNYQDYG